MFLTTKQQQELVRRWQTHQDHAARAELVERLQPQVRATAKRYVGKHSQDDLIQSANLQLLRAIDLYREDGGSAFWVYASLWMRHGCRLAAEAARCVVSGPSRQDADRRVAQMPELPSDSGKVSAWFAKRDAWRSRSAVSWTLDAPMGEDGDTFGDMLPSPFEPPDDAIDQAREAKRLNDAVSQLDVRSREILMRGDRPLVEVGKKWGITRQRASQVELVAIRRLRQQLAGREDHV